MDRREILPKLEDAEKQRKFGVVPIGVLRTRELLEDFEEHHARIGGRS
jgi:hypothetical protein